MHRGVAVYPCFALATIAVAGCGNSDPDPTHGATSAAQIYVAAEDQGTIDVIDHDRNERSASIQLPTDGDMYMPHNVQAAPDGASVWVTAAPMTHGGSERAFVIDPATNSLEASIDLGSGLHVAHVVLDPSSSKAYVTANEADAVIEIDVATRKVTQSFDLGTGARPHGARYCQGALWVAAMGGKALLRLDPRQNAVERVELGGVAVQTACTPDGRYVFASLYDTKEVVRYEITSGELVRVALPAESQGPVQLYPSPDSSELWVCDQGVLNGRPASNKLYRIAVDAAEISGTVNVGQGAHGVVVSEDGARVYVTNVVDSTVSVVDASTLEVIATVGVGAKPNGISHWHGNGAMP